MNIQSTGPDFSKKPAVMSELGLLGVASGEAQGGGFVQPILPQSELLNTNTITPTFLSLTQHVDPVTGVSSQETAFIGNTESSLSNLRGSIGINTPLGEEAVYVNGGLAGGVLNTII